MRSVGFCLASQGHVRSLRARSKFALYTAGLADYMHMKDEAAMWMRRVIHEFTPDNMQVVSAGVCYYNRV